MELWQLKNILNKLNVDAHVAERIMAEAVKTMADDGLRTMSPAEVLGTMFADPIELRESELSVMADAEPLMTSSPVNPSETFPTALGQYEDLGVLGEGSMGAVRLVLDRKLNRRLAMKVIHPNLLHNDTAAGRFAEEAQVCAQLQHPNIVPVHDLGMLPDGRLYFTMKAIKGRSLDTVIRAVHGAVRDGQFQPTEDGWTFHRLIDVFRQVCQAVGYAHSKGVLHRDLKPENIMLGEFGEVLVVDWGLAKVLGRADRAVATEEPFQIASSRDATHATKMGQVAGTPVYMAPEQARGEVDKLNAQTDVYTLGAILYEILSGRVPYWGPSPKDIIAQVKAGPPPPLSAPFSQTTGLQLPEELVVACTVAMSRLQHERYASAEKLGDVLQQWLEGAREREKALAFVHQSEPLSARVADLKQESERLFKEAQTALVDIPNWESEEVKGPHWEKERQAVAKQLESERLDATIEHNLQNALSHKIDLIEAHEALARRYLQDHATAEQARDEHGMTQGEVSLRHHAEALPAHNAVRQQVFHYLKGTGALSLQTDVDGVEIYLEQYVPHHRRLVPKRIAHLGNKPLVAYPLEMGSYRLLLQKEGYRDVVYPVHIGRGEHWDGVDPSGVQRPVHIPKHGAIAQSACFIPAGWFVCGGHNPRSAYTPRRRWVDDVVMSQFPVTNAEYVFFLNSLLAEGREDDALQWVPRNRAGREGELGSMIYGRDRSGRFFLTADADGDVWEPNVPVSLVDARGAEAYCAWWSAKHGIPCRLPGDIEWEKAARGVDGRWHVWGDGFDPSYTCMVDSHQKRRVPANVDAFPIDESVYGIRGMAGNMSEWTSSVFRPDWDTPEESGKRTLRGGSWIHSGVATQCTYRNSCYPTYRYSDLGFRLVFDLPK